MRVLIVTEASSPHAARWINQLRGSDLEVCVFQAACPAYGVSAELQHGTLHYPGRTSPWRGRAANTLPLPFGVGSASARNGLVARWIKARHLRSLERLISGWRPDVIHSHGLHVNAGNLLLPVLEVLQRLGAQCQAPWLYSSWGADLSYYARTSEANRTEVAATLECVDLMTSECNRDLRLAREMGFAGRYLGRFPDFGGLHPGFAEFHSAKEPPSRRKVIFMKGRDVDGGQGDPVGRAMTIIRAIEASLDVLKEAEVVIAQATPNVRRAALQLQGRGCQITILDRIPYAEMLGHMARARIFAAATVADGLPSSLVESMALGTFPVHGHLESIAEYVEDGRTGLLPPSEEVEEFAAALRRAWTNDALVDAAAHENALRARNWWNAAEVRAQTIGMYKSAGKEVAHARFFSVRNQGNVQTR